MYRLHCKFTLARIHNLRETTAYAHLENIAGDPNLTIEVIQRELKRTEAELGMLPPALAIQLDNCFRENKNSYIINFCGWMVERGTRAPCAIVYCGMSCLVLGAVGLFAGGIFISFLPKGHTHNEMDQCASLISIAVRRKDIHTRQQLHDVSG